MRRWVMAAYVTGGLLAGGQAGAAVFSEPPDAGDLIGTAANVGAGINQITGSNATGGTIGEVDVFRLNLPGGAFTATVTAQGQDMALVLFNSAGIGLRADDDSAGGVRPQVSATLAAGVYYLGIFPINDYFSPTSSGGRIWANVFLNSNTTPDGPGSASPWTGWDAGSSSIDQGGTYTIALNQTTVGESIPEPASLALLGLGLAGLAAARRRRL